MRRKTDAVVRHSTEPIEETAANVRGAARAIPDRAASLVCANALGAADPVAPLRDSDLVRDRGGILAADHAAPFRGLDDTGFSPGMDGVACAFGGALLRRL